MPSAAEYQARIENYSRDDVLALWQAIQNGDTPEWAAGKALEYLVLRAFQIEGATVTYPYTVTLQQEPVEQIDGAIYCDGLSCLVEAKDQLRSMNVEPIAKMRNQLLRRHASTIGVIFSRSGFTTPASILARYLAPNMILLWGNTDIGYGLEHQLMRRSLIEKYRTCIETGLPDYNMKEQESS